MLNVFIREREGKTMNTRTGYELELNHSRQSQIRQQFEHQEFVRQAKSTNSSSSDELARPVSRGLRHFTAKSRLTVARWLVNLTILTGLVLAVVQLTGSARASSLDSL